MKKIFFILLAAIFFLPLFSYASSVGGTDTPGRNKLSIGIDQEFVFDRDLTRESWSMAPVYTIPPITTPIAVNFNNISTLKINNLSSTLVKFGYGILDNLEVYLKAGTFNAELLQNYGGVFEIIAAGIGFPILSGSLRYRTEGASFAYGGGVKGTYDLPFSFLIGGDVQYTRYQSHYNALNSALMDTTIIIGSNAADYMQWQGTLTFQEWQVSGFLGKKIGNFMPYIGAKYSSLSIRDRGKGDARDSFAELSNSMYLPDLSNGYKKTYKNDSRVSPFVGLDYKADKDLSLNVEASFIDEKAISFGGTYKFIDSPCSKESTFPTKFHIGLEQDYVFDRDLKEESWSLTESGSILGIPGTIATELFNNITTSKIDNMYRTLMNIGYNPWDFLGFYVKLGTVDGSIRENYTGVVSASGPGGGNLVSDGELRYKLEGANFAYGGGVIGKYNLPWWGLAVGCDADYLRHESNYNLTDSANFTNAGLGVNNSLAVETWQGKLIFQEWKISPYLSKKIGCFSPYIGFSYSNLSITDKSQDRLQSSIIIPPDTASISDYIKTYTNKNKFSPFVGLDFNIGRSWTLNAQASFVDEDALKLSGSFKF